MINFLAFLSFAFISGSLPLSLWLGKLFLKEDIRGIEDGNPGAANVWRAGGKFWGFLAVLLDFLKGAVPVGLANFLFVFEGWQLCAIGLAPIVGNAFSPFLQFRGGKLISVTFGIWCGLTLWVVPVVLGIALGIWLAILVIPGWAILAGMFSLLVFILAADLDTIFLWVWLGNTLLLLWKHKEELRQLPNLRDGILGKLKL